MIRSGAIALALIAGATGAATAQSADDATATPATQPSPRELFERECGICHGPVGTGTMMLARRMDEDKAQLARRTDLQPGYVKVVVRNGIASMPAITRVEVTDDELDQIAAYLAGDGK